MRNGGNIFAVPERSLHPRIIIIYIGKLQLGKHLCALEPKNSRDRNAVAVEKEGKIVGHLPARPSADGSPSAV